MAGLDEISAIDLPPFLEQLEQDDWSQLTQATLTYFLSTTALLPGETELCFSLLSFYNIPTLESRIEIFKNKSEIKSEYDGNDLLLHRIRQFFDDCSIPKQQLIISSKDILDTQDKLSRLPNDVLLHNFTAFLNQKETIKLRTVNRNLNRWLTIGKLFSSHFDRELWKEKLKIAEQALSLIIKKETKQQNISLWKKRSGTSLLIILSLIGIILGEYFIIKKAENPKYGILSFVLFSLFELMMIVAIANRCSADEKPKLIDLPLTQFQQSYPQEYQKIQTVLNDFQRETLTLAEVRLTLQTLNRRMNESESKDSSSKTAKAFRK